MMTKWYILLVSTLLNGQGLQKMLLWVFMSQPCSVSSQDAEVKKDCCGCLVFFKWKATCVTPFKTREC